ncbi:MAG: hypothetical protein Q7R77_00690 [Candidatus Daviesbacteria bacterium]|nr:hypothetical protein [Candidatus Daviesbacteria bacterium]
MRPESRRKFLLGEALSNIRSDDGNYFMGLLQALRSEDNERFRKGASDRQVEYEARLSTEIEAIGLPQEVKERLELIRDTTVKGVDWSNEGIFLGAYRHWYQLSGLVREIVQKNPKLNEAVTYHMRILNEVSETNMHSSRGPEK